MKMKMKDIAKMLDVSPATISLALNNRPGISEATRQRVKQAVRELGQEELLGPVDSENKTILFVVYQKHGRENDRNPYFSQLFSEIIESVEKCASDMGYRLMISYLDKDNYRELFHKTDKSQIDGVLLLATAMEAERIREFLQHNIPTVILDNYIEEGNTDCITINNEQGVYEAVSYLARCGHREVGYLHVLQNAYNFTERYFGCRRAMELNQLPFCQEYYIEIETARGGEELYAEIRHKLGQLSKMPTAFFADNDIVAMNGIKALKEMGCRVPEDVSMVGFDNMSVAKILDPPLTTIHCSKSRMGQAAVQTLAGRISRPDEMKIKTEVGTRLIERGSVKCRKEDE